MKLTLNDVISKKITNIWAINNTRGKDRSTIVLSVPSATGNSVEPVVVPSTFLPINLTGYVSHKQLIDSSNFRRAITKGLIQLVDEEEANELLGREGATEEKARLAALDAAIDNLIPKTVVDLTDNTGEDAILHDSSGVNVGVVVAINSLADDGELVVINSLRSMGELTEVDYKYVAESSSGFPKLAAWAKAQGK